jgi:hypothetical protein
MNKMLFKEILMPEGDGNSAGGTGAGNASASNGSGGESQGGVSNAGSFESMGIEAEEAENSIDSSKEAEAQQLIGETDQNLNTSINSEIDIPDVDPGVKETDTSDLMKPGEIRDFNLLNIKQIPKSVPGIYHIYEENEGRLDEAYIGQSTKDIRVRLRSHHQGRGNKTVAMMKGYEDQFNPKFSYQLSDNPKAEEPALLEGPFGLPPGNQRRETSHLENYFENEDKSVEELGKMIEENKSNKEKELEKARESEMG